MTEDMNEVCSSQNYLLFRSTMGWLKERAIKDNIPSQCSELTESIITFLFSKNLISQIIGVQTQHKCKKITFNILEYLFRLFSPMFLQEWDLTVLTVLLSISIMNMSRITEIICPVPFPAKWCSSPFNSGALMLGQGDPSPVLVDWSRGRF